jgi:hypothetical protein
MGSTADIQGSSCHQTRLAAVEIGKRKVYSQALPWFIILK